MTSVLRGSASALGLIEGVSDGMLGVATLVGGALANDRRRQLPIARGGYLAMAAATGAIAATVALWQVALLRATAWSARGLRSPARDAMLTSLARPMRTAAHSGSNALEITSARSLVPLAAAGLVAWLGIRPALWLAAVPAALAAVAIGTAAAEVGRIRGDVAGRAGLELRRLREAGLVRPMLPIAMFEVSNVSTALLILRSTDLLRDGRSAGAATSLAVLIYAAHNASASCVAFLGGHWIDHAGPRRVFATGAIIYVAAYAGFALPLHTWPAVLMVFALAGCGIGLAEAAESTFVAQRLPGQIRGSGFGVLGGLQAFGGLASSAVVGLLWTALSPTIAFSYAALWMLLSAATAAGSRFLDPPTS